MSQSIADRPASVARAARRYWRLYWAFVRNSVAREMEFRTNFYFGSAINVLASGLYVVFFSFIFRHTKAIAGWSADQVVLLLGAYMVTLSLVSFLFARNMGEISRLVNRAELDYVLLKPVNSQFMVSLRFIDLSQLPRLMAGIGIVGLALARMGSGLTVTSLLAAGLAVASAMVMLYSLWFMTVTLVFYAERAGNVHFLFYSLVELARVPLQAFPRMARPFLSYLLPVGFVATFPSEALIGVLQPVVAGLGVLVAAAWLAVSAWFWNISLRRYAGAST